jgi:SulP family sulfate permease
MVAGVTVGVVLACFLLVKRLASLTHADVSHASTGRHRKVMHLNLSDEVMIYHINGPLFFGTVEQALNLADSIHHHITTLIIDMENVPLIDMSALVAMKGMIMDMHQTGRTIVLCGTRDVTNRLLRKLPLSVKYRLKVTETIEEAAKLIAGSQ